MKEITELQNLNDRIYKLVEILKRKQANKEFLTVQAELLEEMADEMREILTTINVQAKNENKRELKFQGEGMEMLQNNYHCTELECGYKTNGKNPEEADLQLVQDGGFDVNKKTMCPKCKMDSLVFIPINE